MPLQKAIFCKTLTMVSCNSSIGEKILSTKRDLHMWRFLANYIHEISLRFGIDFGQVSQELM